MRVLLAHGSSDSAHAEQVDALAGNVSTLLGDSVTTAFLSDARLPAGAEILPLFLGAGVHVTKDAPALAAVSNCRLLPAFSTQTDAISSLILKNSSQNSIFLLYQTTGFEALQNRLQEHGPVACLHGEPSLTTVLQQQHQAGASGITVQPVLLFPGHSLARVRSMISESAIPDVTVAPVLSELDGFAELVAECFRSAE
ncbi:hypothetical protein [Mariprofundus sp. KV]|uniref:sirohydrochlorin chelatase n=1 Tax=Mariprofundus sp. KV TaxID=2608715 RepID=UPI0015A3BF07|nr:hypothetical protein [Mariprofundus sp. KV]NWF36714.1 hypothetical protein [Mariprofundus sp. KV]